MDKKIIITNHAIQRRPWHPKRNRDVLYNLVKEIEDRYKISQMQKSTYKAHLKGWGLSAVIKNDTHKLVLLTLRASNHFDFSNIDFSAFEIKESLSKVDKLKLKGMIDIVYRTNLTGRVVVCGYIYSLKYNKSDDLNDFKYKLILYTNIFQKYDIPVKNDTVYFNNYKELGTLIHLNQVEKKYFLNDFPRKVSK